MLIKIKVPYRNKRIGEVIEVSDGIGNTMITSKRAEIVNTKMVKPVAVRNKSLSGSR